MLPHVTIFNEVSIDGRVTLFPGDIMRYYRTSVRWQVDAILMGSETAFHPDEQEDEAEAVAAPKPPQGPPPPGWNVPLYQPRPLLVIPDSRGRIHNWRSFQRQPWWRHMIALCSQTTPVSYLEYLRKRHVEYIVAGEERVDLRSALAALYARYNVRSILTDCGGALNGALLRAGLVDEISVLLNPSVVSGSGKPTLVDWPEQATAETVVPLTLTGSRAM
jgi:2,5-diamino-6-(ribosylamino)-4(3H)-pyrimidinone 5'-phosphate reductase